MDTRASTRRRALGVLLVLTGVVWASAEVWPGLFGWLDPGLAWPLIVVGIGAALLAGAVVTDTPDMAVGALVVGGIGTILMWQNATGHWESWAWIWSLIPGFVGLGILVAGALKGTPRQGLRDATGPLVASFILFLIFGTFLGGMDLNLLGPYWPVLLIVLGLATLMRRRPHPG